MIEVKFKEYKESKFADEKSKFEIKINDKNYLIDFLNKKQVNTASEYPHDISNEIPNILKYQWSWLDDLKEKSPVSLIHSEIIEKSYANGEDAIKIKIKRQDNDINEIYEYIFKFI